MECGYGEKLALYFYGEAVEAVRAEVEGHLAECACCRAELAALKAVSGWLSKEVREPSSASEAAIMSAARAAAASRRGFSFSWRGALFSGALSAAMFAVFAFSVKDSFTDLSWNGKVDSGLDSVEYSVYQAQSEIASTSGDWDYGYGALEDESLQVKNTFEI